MTISHYFTDRALKVRYKMRLDSHQNNHTNSKITIQPMYTEKRMKTRYVNKILKEMAIFLLDYLNQCKFKYQTVFSASFDKQDEDGQMVDEIQININLNNIQNSTDSDNKNVNVRFQLDHQI